MSASKILQRLSNRALPVILVPVAALALAGCPRSPSALKAVTTHADEATAAWKQADGLIAAGRYDEAEGSLQKALQEAEQARSVAGDNSSDDIAAQLQRASEAVEQARIRQAVIAADQQTRPKMEAIAEETGLSEEKVVEVIKGVVCDSMEKVDEGEEITWDFLYESIGNNVEKAAFGEDEQEKFNERVEAIDSIRVAVFERRTASNAADAFRKTYCDLV
jgi:hypothetical protein